MASIIGQLGDRSARIWFKQLDSTQKHRHCSHCEHCHDQRELFGNALATVVHGWSWSSGARIVLVLLFFRRKGRREPDPAPLPRRHKPAISGHFSHSSP
jgi:hypothetical protein